MFHNIYIMVFSDGEGFDDIYGLVQKFATSFVVETLVVIDDIRILFLFILNYFGTVKYLVEKAIANANTPFGDENAFEDFLVLVLYHVIF